MAPDEATHAQQFDGVVALEVHAQQPLEAVAQPDERRAEFRGGDRTITVVEEARRPEIVPQVAAERGELELRLRQVELPLQSFGVGAEGVDRASRQDDQE